MPSGQRFQKRALNPLTLELWMVVSDCVGVWEPHLGPLHHLAISIAPKDGMHLKLTPKCLFPPPQTSVMFHFAYSILRILSTLTPTI